MGRCYVFVLNLFFLVLLSLPAVSLAYPIPVDFDGKLLRWERSADNPHVVYEVLADDEDDFNRYFAYAVMAADIWNEVPGSFLRLRPQAEGETASITVHLARNFGGNDQSSGYATFDDVDGNGPVHCQIEVAMHDSLSTYSFGKTILHELGHCVGLGHTLMPKAIMSYYLAENEFGLDVDDEAAIVRLYPASGAKPKLPPGCSINLAQPAAKNWLIWPLLLSPLAIIMLRRKLEGGRKGAKVLPPPLESS